MATNLKELVKEEYARIHIEVMKKAPSIAESLEKLRVELLPSTLKRTNEMGVGSHIALERRLQVDTVSKLLDIPVNELVMYFLNNVKTSNERQLVEYRMRHVYFYAV